MAKVRRSAVLISLVLLLLTFATFRPVLDHDFVNFDDPLYVTENPQTQAGLTLEGIGWAFTELYASNWHPLTLLSHMLDCELFGLNPKGHHLTSFLLHLANVVLLFLLLRQMTGSIGRSAFVAALFAVHPLHVESVAWVAERKDVLSTVFWFLTISAYVRFTRCRSTGAYIAVVAAFALGLMAKSMLVTLPFILLLLDVWPLGRLRLTDAEGVPRQLARLVVEKLPLFALSAGVGVVTLVAQSRALSPTESLSFGLRLANALVAYATYLVKTFLPLGLGAFSPLQDSIAWWKVLAAAGLVAAVTLFVLVRLRRAPYLGLGWAWYLVTLLPVIGLVQIGAQSMADRYTYVPLIGLLIGLVWGAYELIGDAPIRRLVAAAGAAAIVTVLVLAARVQVGYWADSVALFERALDVTENNVLAHINLAEAYRVRNHRQEAVGHFQKAIALKPDSGGAHAGLGNALWSWDRPAEAVPYLRRALELDPQDDRIYHSLAKTLSELGEVEEAIELLEAALALERELPLAHWGLGDLYQVRGETGRALEHYRQALAEDPELIELYGKVGILLAREGALEEAESFFAEAVRRRPDSAVAHFNLGVTLRQLNRPRKAEVHLRRALRLDPRLRPPASGGEELPMGDRVPEKKP